jgi:hypothetical protein
MVAVVFALVVSACGGSSPTTPTPSTSQPVYVPTVPTIVNVTGLWRAFDERVVPAPAPIG